MPGMIEPDSCVEEALRAVEHRLLMIGFFLECAAQSDEQPPAEAFSGLADAVHEMERALVRVRKTLSVDALCDVLKPLRE